jgi:hypothetical protein
MTAQQPAVSISRWRGVNPSTGEPDVPRFSIEHQGRTLHSYGTEEEALDKIEKSGWRLVGEGEL